MVSEERTTSFMKLVRIGIKKVLIPVALFVLNSILIYPLFTGEYTQHIESIESAFLSDAKFIVENYPNINWNPQWYCGFPFHLFYTPLIPYLIAFFNILFPVLSIAKGYRLLTAIMYALGPVTLYLFVKYLTKRESTAIIAALIYSLAPSISYLVIPEVSWAADYFKFAPWRLIVLTVYGEAPHVSGLTVIPLACLAFLHVLKNPSYKNYVMSSLTIALIALINLVALYALGIILIILWLSEAILGDVKRKLQSSICCVLIAYALSSFQYDVSFISALTSSGAVQPENIIRLPSISQVIPILVISIPILTVLLGYVSKKPKLQPLFISLICALLFLSLVSGWYIFHINLAPQSFRYIPELDLFTAILLAWLYTLVYDKFKDIRICSRFKVSRYTLSRPLSFRGALVLIMVISLIASSFSFLQSSWPSGSYLAKPNELNMTETPEYRIAEWLSNHVAEGERVYATGTVSFWLNVFSNVPQLRGGADHAATNPWWAHVTYQINKGSNGSLAIGWAKAFNIKYIVVDYPNATTPYKDYIYPQKFEGSLNETYSYESFKVFEVPLKHSELVQLVDMQAALKVNSIRHITDSQNLFAYVNFIENSTTSIQYSYKIESADRMKISIQNLTRNTGVVVKITYDERWKAYLEGSQAKITPIGPFFMLINPDKQGKCDIQLICEKTSSEIGGLIVTVIAICFLFAYSVHPEFFLYPKIRKISARQLNN